MNEVIIAAIAAGLSSVITIVGKVIVDITKAKKEPDKSDLELKDELEREKEKNEAAIEAFTNFGKEIKSSVENLKNDLTQRIEDVDKRLDDMDKRIEDYRKETREINKSAIRHSITEIYFEHCNSKTLDMRTKEDLCSLYNAYSSVGGNSFAHELYEEMMTWQVK